MREKYEAALGEISDAIEEYCLVVNKEMYSKLEKAQDTIMQLIENHFDNPPLKFEELEVGMWVWDNKEKMYIKSCNNFDTEENGKGIRVQMGFDLVRIKFEENRFYRKQVE